MNDADVYGCYAANVAPSIMLASDGMHILQERFPTIPFHLERQKTGIALTADRPVQVKTVDGHPTYSFYRPGSGTYFPLFHVVNGQRYGAFETINSDGFSVLARDDTSVLTYFRTSNSACSAK